MRVYAGDASRRPPTEVTESHCYEGAQMTAGTWAYLELLEDGRLAVAQGWGTCPVELPADQRVFECWGPRGTFLCPAWRAVT